MREYYTISYLAGALGACCWRSSPEPSPERYFIILFSVFALYERKNRKH
jgi:hypothetical protein